MKKERIFSLFLIFVLLFSLVPSAQAANGFDVDAKAALLIDVGSGEVLFEKNAHEKHYPASITKVMTALLTLDAVEAGRLKLDQEIVAGEEATQLPSGASTVGLKVGEVLTVEELLFCLLIPSANEAGNVLAEAVSGSVPAFVSKMNERARELGCENTHFMNPHGLHDDEHYTTAWDIYLITRAAMRYDEFMKICGSKAHTVPETNLSRARELHSTNYLISTWRTGWPGYFYEPARGIKTGYTPEAGYCLVASAVRDERELVSVVLGAEKVSLEDNVTETRSFTETIKLFDHGFDDFKSMRLLSPDEYVCEVPVELSSETNYVVAHPAEGIERMVPSDLELDALTRTITLNAESVDAPIAEGDELGTITISYDGKEYGTVPLLALNDVSASWLLTKQREVQEFLAKPWLKFAAGGVAALALGFIILRIANRSRRGSRYSGGRRSGYTGYRGRRKR